METTVVTVAFTPDDMRKIYRLIEKFADMNKPEEAVPRLLRAIPDEVFVLFLRAAGMETRSLDPFPELPGKLDLPDIEALLRPPDLPDSEPLIKKPDPPDIERLLIEALLKKPYLPLPDPNIEALLKPPDPPDSETLVKKPDPFQAPGIEPDYYDYNRMGKEDEDLTDRYDDDKSLPS